MPRKAKVIPNATRDDGKGNARLAPDGSEMLDDTPLAIPTRLTRSETLAEKVARMLQSERMRQAAHEQGFESFEESEDFDVDDDFDPHSEWENDFDIPLDEMRRRAAELHEMVKERKRQEAAQPPSTIVEPAAGGHPKPSESGGGKA